MLESDISRKVRASLNRYGYWVITQTDASEGWCERCKAKVTIYPPSGRPDMIVIHPTGLSIVVEVKMFKLRPDKKGSPKSFPFDKIDDKQRSWLDNWHEAHGKGYIALGVVEKLEERKKDKLLGIWLVDWIDWLDMEKDLREFQKSIPWNANRSRFEKVREHGYDIPRRLGWFSMTHLCGDTWELQKGSTALQ
jgi:hypothetical protein